jgi:hypothetical protein
VWVQEIEVESEKSIAEQPVEKAVVKSTDTPPVV